MTTKSVEGENVHLFFSTLDSVPQPTSKLLESYSGIPPESQVQHVLTLRDRAYALFPYPCLGRFRFLELDFSLHPLYKSHIIPIFSNKTGNLPIFLDLGTCLGQDLRKLIVDTNPALPVTHIYGADLKPEFIDIGYSLFRDEDKLPKSQLITPADVFDKSPSNNLSVLDGKVGVLHTSAVFHLFSLEDQVELARRCLKLVNRNADLEYPRSQNGPEPKPKRALVCGSQTANTTAGDFATVNGKGRFRHNDASWREMWEGVVAEPEWRDVIKGIEVHSILQKRERKVPPPKVNSGEREKTADGNERVETIDEGFRWMVWWVWVDFV